TPTTAIAILSLHDALPISNAIQVLVNPGDEVIILAPYWVSYSEMVKLADGKSVIVEGAFENNFKVTPAQLEAAITPRTKVVMYASPNNPTRSEEHTSELQSREKLVCRLLLEK